MAEAAVSSAVTSVPRVPPVRCKSWVRAGWWRALHYYSERGIRYGGFDNMVGQEEMRVYDYLILLRAF